MTPASIELLEKAPTPERFLTIFNPSTQVRFTASIDKVYEGNTPSLGLTRTTYGANTTEAWVEIQLNELSEFAGCKGKLDSDQTEQMARMILQSYGQLTIAQLMLFFQKFKRCEYGKFYGAVDPMVIMGALSDFADEVAAELQRRQQVKEKLRQQEEDRRLELEKEPYRRRIPGAFTPEAVIDWCLYCILRLKNKTDEQVARLVADIQSGKKKLPTLAQAMRWSPEHIAQFTE